MFYIIYQLFSTYSLMKNAYDLYNNTIIAQNYYNKVKGTKKMYKYIQGMRGKPLTDSEYNKELSEFVII